MKRLALTHKINRFSEIDPNNPNPIVLEVKEDRHILPTGGEHRVVETNAFYLQSGRQALPRDVLLKCRECGGIAEMKSAFECTGCHRTFCKDHLKKEEVIEKRTVQRRDIDGDQIRQYEYDKKQRFCDTCWRRESMKRTIQWLIELIFCPLIFLKGVLQENDGQVDQLKEVEEKQTEACEGETAES